VDWTLFDHPDPVDRISVAIDENRDELDEARQELARAMRDDVGHRPLPAT
jgi:hypothetical protein